MTMWMQTASHEIPQKKRLKCSSFCLRQNPSTLSSYLQDERDAGREEGHEDEVVGQDGYAAETTHKLQLLHT